MANPNSTEGFVPVDHQGQGCLETNEYTIALSYTTAIHRGDPVKLTGTGRNIELAAAGDKIVGVFAGVEYDFAEAAQGGNHFSYHGKFAQAELKAARALVYDDPDTIFQIAASGSSGINTVGNNCDFTLGGDAAAAKRYGKGTAQVDSATFATTADVLRVIGFARTEDNDSESDYARMLVVINDDFHQHKSPVGT